MFQRAGNKIPGLFLMISNDVKLFRPVHFQTRMEYDNTAIYVFIALVTSVSFHFTYTCVLYLKKYLYL